MDSGKSKIKIEGEHALSVSEIQCVLNKVCAQQKRKIRRLVYQNVSRESIIALNKTHLNHNYETDIITFDYSHTDAINAEIFICPEVVAENAERYNQPIEREKKRVYIHGLLHLVGFDDQTEGERMLMRQEEERWLTEHEI